MRGCCRSSSKEWIGSQWQRRCGDHGTSLEKMEQKRAGHRPMGKQTDDKERLEEDCPGQKAEWTGSLLTTFLELAVASPAVQTATLGTDHDCRHHRCEPESQRGEQLSSGDH